MRKKVSSIVILLYICMLLFSCPGYGIEARGGDGEVFLTWIAPTQNEDGSPLTDLAGYYVYRALEVNNPFERVNQEPFRGICYTDTNLLNGVTYFYAVTAVDFSGNESKKSPIVLATPYILPPSNLRGKPGYGVVDLFWEPYANSPLKGYNVYRKSALEQVFSKVTPYPIADPFFTDKRVANGVAYFYKVSCVGIEGIEGEFSQEVSVTPMARPPHELSAVQAHFIKNEGLGYVRLQWEEGQEEGIIGYKVYRRLLREREFNLLTPSPIMDIYYMDYSVTLDQEYLYSVVAVNERGFESQYPREVQCFTAPAYISSFSHDTQGKPKKAGDHICFSLRGEPGGTASYKIEGFITPLQPMEEIEEGLYQGCVIVTKDMSIEQGKAIGYLEDKIGNISTISAEEMINVDNQPPKGVIEANAVWNEGVVTITWALSHEEGETIDILRKEEGITEAGEGGYYKSVPARVGIFNDGDIRPDRSYHYTLFVLDRAKNRSAPFHLPPIYIPYQEGIPSIREIRENTKGIPLKTGDSLEIELIGDKGCTARFFIPDLFTLSFPMEEVQPGLYRGVYKVGSEDKLDQGLVKVCLNDNLAHSNCQVILSGIMINSRAEDTLPPVIDFIKHNAFEIAGFSGSLVPGDFLEITMNGEEGGKAWFFIAPEDFSQDVDSPDKRFEVMERKAVTNSELLEQKDSPGIYEGGYQFNWGDRSLSEAYIWVCLSDRAGNKSWKRSNEVFSLDTRPKIEVVPKNKVLWIDQDSHTPISVKVMDANKNPVEGHHVALSLSTTDEYTGVVGGGGFGREMEFIKGIDFDSVTDSWGEIEVEYRSGFSAKTALIIAKDLTTGHAGVGYILSVLKAQTDIRLDPPLSLSRFLKASPYRLILSADPERLTADGVSNTWITAKLADYNGTYIEKKGLSVSFYLEGRNGSLSNSQAETDSSGEAHTRYTAGILRGTILLTAVCNSEDEFDKSSGEIRIALMSDAPAQMDLRTDPNLIADGKSQSHIRVWVADVNNNAVQQAMVGFSVLQNNRGELSDLSTATDFNGWAECIYTSPNLEGESASIATIRATIISKAPEEAELSKAAGTIFVPILYPGMKEDDEVSVAEWLCRKGDMIQEGMALIRLETRSGIITLKALLSGELVDISVHKGEDTRLGQTLGYIYAKESYQRNRLTLF